MRMSRRPPTYRWYFSGFGAHFTTREDKPLLRRALYYAAVMLKCSIRRWYVRLCRHALHAVTPFVYHLPPPLFCHLWRDGFFCSFIIHCLLMFRAMPVNAMRQVLRKGAIIRLSRQSDTLHHYVVLEASASRQRWLKSLMPPARLYRGQTLDAYATPRFRCYAARARCRCFFYISAFLFQLFAILLSSIFDTLRHWSLPRRSWDRRYAYYKALIATMIHQRQPAATLAHFCPSSLAHVSSHAPQQQRKRAQGDGTRFPAVFVHRWPDARIWNSARRHRAQEQRAIRM